MNASRILLVLMLASCAHRDEAKHVDLDGVLLRADADAPRVVERPRTADAAWCDRLARRNDAFVGPSRFDEDAGCFAPELSCVANDAGAAWGFVVSEAHATNADGVCSTTTHVDVVRSDGTSALAPASSDAGLALAQSAQSAQSAFRWQREDARVELLGDLDGDGDEEALVTRMWSVHEEGSGETSRVWTTKGHDVVPYAPTRNLVIVEARDVDGDGRADFVTRGPYEGIEAQSQLSDMALPVAPDIFVAHSLSGGKLSMDDATAVAFTLAECKARGTAKAVAIVCGRVRGRTEAEVLDEQRRAGCADFDEDETRYPSSCEKWIPALAHVTPPFIFSK